MVQASSLGQAHRGVLSRAESAKSQKLAGGLGVGGAKDGDVLGLEGQRPRESSVHEGNRAASREHMECKGGQSGWFFLLGLWVI